MKTYIVIKDIAFPPQTSWLIGAEISEGVPIFEFLKENNLIDKYLEEIKPELTYKPFTPDDEEDYYYVSDNGEIAGNINVFLSFDQFRINSGNAFRTKEEAEYHRDWLIARKRIMDSSDFVPDWEDEYQTKYIVTYSDRGLMTDFHTWTNYGSPAYYKTKDQAQQAIKDLENEYLVYFGVKRKLED